MTYQEIASFIENMGFPCAYHQFLNGTAEPPPFICWFFPGIDDLYADNSNYQRIVRLIIEFYSDEKDFAGEATIEAALKEGGFSYTKDEDYIDSERLHETVYEMEVIIHGS